MSERNCKKILILGATGPTGILTVQTAFEHHHIVTIYARNPSKLPTNIGRDPNIKVSDLSLDGMYLLNIRHIDHLWRLDRRRSVIQSSRRPRCHCIVTWSDWECCGYPLHKCLSLDLFLDEAMGSQANPCNGHSKHP